MEVILRSGLHGLPTCSLLGHSAHLNPIPHPNPPFDVACQWPRSTEGGRRKRGALTFSCKKHRHRNGRAAPLHRQSSRVRARVRSHVEVLPGHCFCRARTCERVLGALRLTRSRNAARPPTPLLPNLLPTSLGQRSYGDRFSRAKMRSKAHG